MKVKSFIWMDLMDLLRPLIRAWCFALFFLSYFPLAFSERWTNISTDALTTVVRDRAFQTLIRGHSSVVYKVPLPRNLSSMEASVVRVRSNTLWRHGVDIGAVRVPPAVISVPYVKRLIIVHQRFGGLSSTYFKLPGYSLVAPVVGFQAYNASNTSSNDNSIMELGLNARRDSITISFPAVQLPEGMNSRTHCASFGKNGSVSLYKMVSMNMCYARNTGHFAMVVPAEVPPRSSPAAAEMGRRERKWVVWLVACGGGVVGLVLLGLVGMGIFKLARNKKMKWVESRAEDGEALGSVWVGKSKMPSANMIRTQPVLETESPPSL